MYFTQFLLVALMVLLGPVVFASEGVDKPVEDEDQAPFRSALEISRELGISDDDSRPDQQLEMQLFGRRLIVGGEVSGAIRGRGHFDLARGANDDDSRFDPKAKLEAIFLPSETSVVFAAAEAFGEVDVYREGKEEETETGVSLDEFWLLKTQLFETRFALQLGRQLLRDRREWWWDSNVDGLRVHYFGSKLTAYAGVSRNGEDLSTHGKRLPAERKLLRKFANIAWEWHKRQHVELFLLHQSDQTGRYALGDIIDRDRFDERDARLNWAGLRARGCIKPKISKRVCYWGELARVRGSEHDFDIDRVTAFQSVVSGRDKRDVHGWAYDVGLSAKIPVPGKPFLTLGYARGSGDRSGTPGRDGAFRQSGMQKNTGKYRGLSRFRYYGEVLQPELSNIAISTVALGVPLGDSSWIETLWHGYRQPEPDNRITGSPLGENPDGNSGSIGQEVDIVISHRPSKKWEFEFTGGVFKAGSAFGREADRWAALAVFKVDYNF